MNLCVRIFECTCLFLCAWWLFGPFKHVSIKCNYIFFHTTATFACHNVHTSASFFFYRLLLISTLYEWLKHFFVSSLMGYCVHKSFFALYLCQNSFPYIFLIAFNKRDLDNNQKVQAINRDSRIACNEQKFYDAMILCWCNDFLKIRKNLCIELFKSHLTELLLGVIRFHVTFNCSLDTMITQINYQSALFLVMLVLCNASDMHKIHVLSMKQ